MFVKVNRRWKIILFFLGVVVFSLALSYSYIHYIDGLLYRQNVDSIHEIAQQGANRLEDVLHNHTELLEEQARRIQDHGDAEASREQSWRIGKQDHPAWFNLIGLDGTFRGEKGEKNDVSSDPRFRQVLREKRTLISAPFIESESGSRVIAIYAPVLEQGRVKAVLRELLPTSELHHLLNISFFGNSGYSYILNVKGDVLISSGHPESNQSFRNLFVLLREERNESADIDGIEADFATGRQGIHILDFDQQAKFLSYTPIRYADGWYLATVVKENAITRSTRTIVYYSIAMCALLTFILLSVVSVLLVKRQQRRVKRLEKTAYKDELTGLYNRNYLSEISAAVMDLAKVKKMASVALDIDRFKVVNESFGYGHGDAVLSAIAQNFASAMERGECAARLKDDLFILILCYESAAQLEKRLQRMLESAREAMGKEGVGGSIAFSCGVYLLEGDKAVPSNLYDYADIARKTIKEYAVTKIAFFERSMLHRLQEEKRLEDRMEHALKHGEFLLYLQPKVDMETGVKRGAEALVRWSSPENGFIFPGKFIPLFEKNGFVTKLDFYMFEQVCLLKKSWRQRNIPDQVVSVNMSRRHLHYDTFITTLVSIADRYEIARDTIEIEITESAFFNDAERLIEMMSKLKDAGFRLSMDDFGTGYSSLNLLRKLPIDVLKLDKEFLDVSEVAPKSRAIMTNIIKMAHDIDVEVICEGVETKKQVNFLLEIGCRYGQGYYFAKPMAISDFEDSMK